MGFIRMTTLSSTIRAFYVSESCSPQDLTSAIVFEYPGNLQNMLWVFQENALSLLSADDMKELSDLVSQTSAHDKTALVALNPRELQQIQEYFEISKKSELKHQLKLFDNEREAISWLEK